jgi:hypothetical protein
VSAIAARHGYALSEGEIAAEMDAQIENATARDLNEEELDQVAAGSCQMMLYLETIV